MHESIDRDADRGAKVAVETRDAAPALEARARGVRVGRFHVDLTGALRSWLGTVFAIVALVIAFSIMKSQFMSFLNWQNIAVQMSVLLVISLAGTFPILIGSIDLSVGSVATLCGIIAAMSLRHGGFVAAATIPIALGIGLGCGLVNGLLLARLRIPSFLVTLGTFFALDGVASWLINGSPVPIIDVRYARIFDGHFGSFPTIFLWAVGVLLLSILVCRSTRLGRHFYAVGNSEPASLIAGVSIRKIKVIAFAVSGLLAAFSGFLLSIHQLSGSPEQSASLLLPSIGAIVIGGTALSGGVGGPGRTFIGVVLLAVLINGMQLAAVNPYLQLVVEGIVVILAVILSRQKLSVFSVVK